MFARIEARRRGEDIGDQAAEKLSLKGHFVRPRTVARLVELRWSLSAEALPVRRRLAREITIRAVLTLWRALGGRSDGRLDGVLHHHARRAYKRCAVSPTSTATDLPPAKLQMQTTGPKLYSGPIDCARQVVRANGVVGLWHGFGATLLFRTWIGALYVCSTSPCSPASPTCTTLC